MMLRSAATARAVAAVGLALSLLASAERAASVNATATDGPLLTQLGTVVASDGTTSDLFFAFQGNAMEFSPDGTMIAGAVDSRSTVTVWSNVGTVHQLATLPGEVQDISWSADQTQLAVLTQEWSGTDYQSRIFRVSVSTGAATSLVEDTAALEISLSSTVSWSPENDQIAFIASEVLEDGASLTIHASQIFTVPAAGGTPTRFNAHLPEECSQFTCTYYAFSEPSWSPDGTKLAVLVEKDVEEVEEDNSTYEQFVGTVAPGAMHPTKVRQTSVFVNPAQWSHLGSGPVEWSTDGTAILYGQRQVQHGDTTPTVISASNGAVLATWDFTGLYEDWQPCPAGTCATWGDEVQRADSVLKGTLPAPAWSRNERPSVTGTLTVTPAQRATGTVRLIVDGKQVRSATLTAAMNNRFSFKMPRLAVGQHTVRLRYGGSAAVEPSSTGIGRFRILAY